MDTRRWVLNDIETQMFQYKVTAGLVPKDKWTERPYDGANSVAMLVWHMARWHDIAINVFLRRATPVFDEGWSQRLGVGIAPGTGFTSDDVDAFGEMIDPVELEAYWHAVFERTAEWLGDLSSEAVDELVESEVDVDSRFAEAGDILPPAAAWVPDFLRGATGTRILGWLAIHHGYWHLGELQTVTTALGYPIG